MRRLAIRYGRDTLPTEAAYHWPDDFRPFDGGQLWVRPDLLPAFDALRWLTVDRVLEADDFTRSTLHPNRDNCHFELPSMGHQPARRVYVKRHRRDRHGATPALDEATAVQLCRNAKVPCMRIAAVGQRHDGPSDNRWHSFFMSDQIGQGQSAFGQVQALKESTVPGADDDMTAIIRAVAHTAKLLHAAGLFHGDCHWPHFLLETTCDGWPIASLIDLQNTRQLHGAAARYAWIKDLAQLRNSMCGLRLTPAEVDHWYDCYFAEGNPLCAIPWPRRAVRLVVDARAELRQLQREMRKRLRKLRRAGMWL